MTERGTVQAPVAENASSPPFRAETCCSSRTRLRKAAGPAPSGSDRRIRNASSRWTPMPAGKLSRSTPTRVNSESSSSNRRSSVMRFTSRDTVATLSRRRRMSDALMSNRFSRSITVSHWASASGRSVRSVTWVRRAPARFRSSLCGCGRCNRVLRLQVTIRAKKLPSRLVQGWAAPRDRPSHFTPRTPSASRATALVPQGSRSARRCSYGRGRRDGCPDRGRSGAASCRGNRTAGGSASCSCSTPRRDSRTSGSCRR
jgi:hypothetical protein